MAKTKTGRVLVLAGSIASCLALWQLASHLRFDLHVVTFRNVPSPVDVLVAAEELARSSKVLSHIGASLMRVFGGFLAACVLAIGLGLAIG